MPSLNEIAEFRNDLKRIAREEQVTAGWEGKVYDELPPPDQGDIPDLDDVLTSLTASQDESQQMPQNDLSSLDTENRGSSDAELQGAAENPLASDNGGADTASSFEDDPALNFDDILSSLDLDSEPAESAEETLTAPSDAGAESDFPVSLDDAGDAAGESSDIPDLSDFDLDTAGEPASESADAPDLSDFDDILSSLDLDSEPAESAEETLTAPSDAGTESGFPASLDDAGGTATESGDIPDLSDFDLDTAGEPASGSTDAPDLSDFDDILSSLNLDSEPAESAEETLTAPSDAGAESDFPVSLDDAGGTATESGGAPDSAFDTAGEPASGSADAPDLSDFDDILSSLNLDSDPAESAEETLTAPSDAGAESGFPASLDEAGGTATESGDAPDSAFDTAGEPASESTDAPDLSAFDFDTALPDENDSGLDELSLFSEDQSPSEPAALDSIPSGGSESLEAEPPDLSMFDDDDLLSSFSDDDISDIPAGEDAEGAGTSAAADLDNAGFSFEDDALDTDISPVTDSQFNLPDTFKDFSDGHTDIDALIQSSGPKKVVPEDDDKSITDEEYARFLNRVNTFPLNMRLAIQDYIGNGNDSDENKLSLIRFVLSKASMKKIAARLEKLLDKSIPIPKHFQSSSVEEYERQKRTLKYWMLHKFLPVAVMVSLALLFAFCITVLSWQFIYKPLKSESLYKTGYAYLENGRYDTAIEKFDKACEYKQKKRWYFTYARGFKERKLFNAAEKMYSRLIYDFKYDKSAGLEYADMLASDLRNYERAEAVIRRLILDYHVNDKDGLTALGDIYMTWGYEEPEKYESAVKIYSRIIELYGKSDALLVRMLRYFIRTDNLAEVLPLKEYFVQRLSKITADDITELGGYLLEKRYNPLPLDSEKLRAKIDDVRLLLEKAIQADKSIPEAYYNLGKFFIYNYKPHAAIENLTESIKRFETVGPMPPLRTVRYIDSMRLLGEQLTTQKKYLDAQNLYAQALGLYKDYTALNPLPANATVGKLYADYGDIDYFISRDFDSALDSYQNAVKQSHDTPSINYRIGYLYYQKEDYAKAIEYISNAYAQKLHDKNLLYGLGNALFKRGNYFAAQAAYEQLIELLDAQRVHKGVLNLSKDPADAEFIENYMHTATNLGATLNQIADRNGDSQKNARALALYAEANRAWDTLTRNPETMVRSKSVSLSYLNTKNMINPASTYKPEIYTDIPMILENERALQQKEDK